MYFERIQNNLNLNKITPYRVVCSLFLLFLLSSCANIQDITGGPEDSKPPALLKELSSPDKQINFSDKTLVFHFDEWIRLDNPAIHIKISPSTIHPLQYKLKGKKLQITFDENEELLPNTTYNIYFGECIKDITKNNVLLNFKYVFSTGSFIDSLGISGQVIDAFTLDPKEKVLIGLYSNLQDSAIEKLKPLYYTWSDKNGVFSLDNIANGRYNIFAISDKNQNYKLDLRTEPMAFFDSSLVLSGNNFQNIILRMNEPKLPLLVKDKVLAPGYTKLVYNRPAEEIQFISAVPGSLIVYQTRDSISIWNSGTADEKVIIRSDELLDTLICPMHKMTEDSIKFSVKRMVNKWLPSDYPVIESFIPFDKVDPEKIIITDSLVTIDSLLIDPDHPQRIMLKGNFKPGQDIQIILLENALINLFGQGNQLDSLRFSVYDYKSLSSLQISLDSFPIGQKFILELIKDKLIIKSSILKFNDISVKMNFNEILPGIYRLRIIEDKNGNGVWDPSDFEQKTQAESIKYYPIPELRANWDVKANINYHR